MNRFRLLSSLGLLSVILAACTSGTSTVSPAQPIEPSVAAPVATLDSSEPAAVPTESLDPTALPVATSRGPDLESSDPATVNLASGGIQLVEFFRFT